MEQTGIQPILRLLPVLGTSLDRVRHFIARDFLEVRLHLT